MSRLRQQMVAAMQLRGFSVRTHQSYLAAVSQLARFHRRSPESLGVAELQAFFAHLACERGLSGASCRLYLNGVRFFYLHVLGWSHFDVPITIPKKALRLPELLTREEVGRLLESCTNPKHRMLLTTCYGCGLRVSEVVALKVRDIDGERRLLRVEQGKGAKDRVVVIGERLLEQLRHYWRLYRPGPWLFPAQHPGTALTITSAQRVFQRAKARAGIAKLGGIHGLRHAYATHQLEAGLPVHVLQRLLGHRDLRTTQQYVHWVPRYREAGAAHPDLIGALERPA